MFGSTEATAPDHALGGGGGGGSERHVDLVVGDSLHISIDLVQVM